MSFPSIVAVSGCVFLATYLLHSTLAVAVAGALSPPLRRWANPELRVLLWKAVLVLPIATAFGVAFLGLPHFGLRVPIAEIVSRGDTPQRTTPFVDDEQIPAGSLVLANRTPADVTPAAGTRAARVDHDALDSDAAPLRSSSVAVAQREKSAHQAVSRDHWFRYTLVLWGLGIAVGVVSLGRQIGSLHRLRRVARRVETGELLEAMNRIVAQLAIRRPVELLLCDRVQGPVTAGWLRPFVMVPSQLGQGAPPDESFSEAERDALLAHELVHVMRGDAWWNLVIQVIRRLFFWQPLNSLAGQQLRKEMDFVADHHAAIVLGQRAGLARCLIRLGSALPPHCLPTGPFVLAAGMAAFRSTLGQRVETLLDPSNRLQRLGPGRRIAALSCLVAGALLISSIVPRAIAQHPYNLSSSTSIHEKTHPLRTGNQPMRRTAGTFALLTALFMPFAGDNPPTSAQAETQTAAPQAKPDDLPGGIQRFNGMLVGRLVAKDIERGTFTVNVDTVSRVWRNSRAENPQALVGKTVQIGGVTGKWLDVLVTARVGETLEFECQHNGEALRFPGELLRKVAPYQPEDYPRLPDGFRGFQGVLVADVVKKDPESFEMLVKVSEVVESWSASKAKQPESIQGKSMLLAGFWNRRDAYHGFKPGDRIVFGMQHISRQSDHVSVHEFVRKQASEEAAKMERMKEAPREGRSSSSTGIQGFRGMLAGRLVKKDIERGTFTITVDAVTRVWNNNQSRNPKSLIGQDVHAVGTTGKMLDTLIVTRVGETIEFGALHNGVDQLRVGEVLRKIAPVEPGDYPEVPDAARGIAGMVTAKVLAKDEGLWSLTVEVTSVDETFPKNRAKNPRALVGKPVTLAGFWNRKDAYQSLKVGDVIRCGVQHQVPLSDTLSVIESIRKVDSE